MGGFKERRQFHGLIPDFFPPRRRQCGAGYDYFLAPCRIVEPWLAVQKAQRASGNSTGALAGQAKFVGKAASLHG